MSAPELARIREVVAATRASQGLPRTVVDPLTVGRVADVLRDETSAPARDAA